MDVMDFDLDEEEDLSNVLGTESLAARDIVPEGFDNTLRARGVLELTQLGRRYTTRPYTGRPVGITVTECSASTFWRYVRFESI
jgi:hypothetical protein